MLACMLNMDKGRKFGVYFKMVGKMPNEHASNGEDTETFFRPPRPNRDHAAWVEMEDWIVDDDEAG